MEKMPLLQTSYGKSSRERERSLTHMPSNFTTRQLPARDRWSTRAGREQTEKGKKEKQLKAQQLLACTQRGDGELGGRG